MHLFTSDDDLRHELRHVERHAPANADEAARWRDLEREVRAHRRWRQLAWILIAPTAAALVWAIVSVVTRLATR